MNRPSIEEIFMKIHAALADGKKKSITDIARESELSHPTVKRYLEIIIAQQTAPKISVEKIGNNYIAWIDNN